MKKIFLLLLLPFSVSSQTQRVLIIGDSWAQLQIDNTTHNQVFSDNNFANITIDPASDNVSDNGKTAADWAQPSQLQIIGDVIAANPAIDTVQLTIGGNDFLNNWTINLTTAEVQTLQQQILTDMTTIVDYVLAQRPNIQILLSFYDYPNFVDTIGGLFGQTCNNLLNDMGVPSVTELNTAAVEFESIYAQIATTNPRVFHVSHTGLMQAFFGFPSQGIPPGQIMPPGDLTKPSPVEAMRDFGVTRDCFHLSPDGYNYLIQNAFDGYYFDRFDLVHNDSFE